MKTKLLNQLKARGYRGQIVNIDRLDDLKQEIDDRLKAGQLNETFFQKFLTGFVFKPPESLPETRSLIVVAVEQPQVRFTFNRDGQQVRVTVPPTYLHWQRTDKQVEDVLAEILQPRGYRVAPTRLPKKLLAACSGLTAYGRNNIANIEGQGSFYRLAAFYSDLPCPKDRWQEPRMMERCQKCFACLQNCPTGAISDDRFLIWAERCITYYNEEPTDVPFPDWLEQSWHNCLVGCMHCQSVCPENKEVIDRIEEGPEFSSEETELILKGAPLDQFPAETVKKLEESDLIDLFDFLPRNLQVFFDRIEI